MTHDDRLIYRIGMSLLRNGEARCRSGKRRSAAAAKKLLQAGADQVSIAVTISKGDGGFVAVANEED
jgi:hypothetical protein